MRLLGYSQDLRGFCVDVLHLGSSIYNDTCVNISDGFVAGLTSELRGALDLRGLNSIALPGVIDIHVHLRGLELSYKEDEASGTMAALAGCITAVIDMPNTKPPLKTVEALRSKLNSLKNMAYVDYGVYAGIPEDLMSVEMLSREPIAGFKVYPEDLRAPKSILCAILRALESKGRILIVHAEHPDMIGLDYGFNRNTYRGCVVETLAVEEVKRLLVECNSRPKVHITHASCPSTILKAKSYGFTVDVTPHHLLFDEHNFRHLASRWCESKVNPPLRDVIERSLLWRLLLEGYVDVIASDHAPHASYEKLWLHPSQCSPGFPGLEDWTGILARIFNNVGLMGLFVKLTSLNPASILGLPKRGLPGSQATFSVLTTSTITSPGCTYSKARVSPYVGSLRFECLASIIRGKLAYYKGEIAVNKGFGVNLFETRG